MTQYLTVAWWLIAAIPPRAITPIAVMPIVVTPIVVTPIVVMNVFAVRHIVRHITPLAKA
jgi:hypothetical protein